jgi:UDP-N-acetylmuramyl pentapeptide synthase
MSARNTLEAKAQRRAEREAHAKAIQEKKVFFPLRRKNRNRYAFIDGAVVDLLEGADLTPEPKAKRRIYGPEEPPE